MTRDSAAHESAAAEQRLIEAARMNDFVREAATENPLRAEWGSLTGWELIVFELEDEPAVSDSPP